MHTCVCVFAQNPEDLQSSAKPEGRHQTLERNIFQSMLIPWPLRVFRSTQVQKSTTGCPVGLWAGAGVCWMLGVLPPYYASRAPPPPRRSRRLSSVSTNTAPPGLLTAALGCETQTSKQGKTQLPFLRSSSCRPLPCPGGSSGAWVRCPWGTESTCSA